MITKGVCMAIFGNLNDVSLVDVFRIVRSKSGVLTMDGIGSIGEITIGLNSNHAVHLAINHRRVESKEDAADYIRRLLGHTTGTFHFIDAPGDPAHRSFLLPLYPILQHAAQVDAIPESELPHPDTRFSVVPNLPEVPGTLSGTWSRLSPLLDSGTSATQAAHVLGTTLRDMQVTLHRCRSMGLIHLTPTTPEPRTVDGAPLPVITRETHSMLRRFMDRLRGRSVA